MFFLRFIILLLCWVGVSHGAVILQYHRFGDERYPSTNIRMEQFRAHLDYLRDNDFTVMPLAEMLAVLRSGEGKGENGELPPRAVALTVDDAFLSFYENAYPLLVEYGYPSTVFIVPDSHDGGGDYMNWQQLREVVDSGLVSIGSQTLSHRALPLLSAAEARRELADSRDVISERLGVGVDFLAYPYGEANLSVISMAEEVGYGVAFGQHSGAVSVASDRYYLPRFAVNEHYGNLPDLINKLHAVALGVVDFQPADPVIDGALRQASFRLSAGDYDGLNCYLGGEAIAGRVENDRYVVEFGEIGYGRTRLNCTKRIDGRWGWFGWQFVRYEEQAG